MKKNTRNIQLLVVQFREKEGPRLAEQRCLLRDVEDLSVELTFINALDPTIAWDKPSTLLEGYDGVLMGGSAEFYFDGELHPEDPKRARVYEAVERMHPFIHRLLHTDVPVLGICMGHQVIAHIMGAPIVACNETGKTGTFNVHLSTEGQKDRLFEGIPETFLAQYAHRDVVDDLPRGAVSLANGERCRYSIIRYGSNIYTMQFHPELRQNDILERAKVHPEYLPEGKNAEETFKESPKANLLIPLFVERVVAPHATGR